MATLRQITANRANAQKSTGPRTAEGKTASSANALKSGIYAKSTLIPGEDPAEYETLRSEHYHQFAPANPDERDLLDLMIKYKWQLRRLHECYDQMWLRGLENDLNSEYYRPTSPLVRPFNSANNPNHSMINLHRMIQSTDRAVHRTRTALIKAQDQRRRAETKAAETKTAEASATASEPAKPISSDVPQPPACLPIGFVPSKKPLSNPQLPDAAPNPPSDAGLRR